MPAYACTNRAVSWLSCIGSIRVYFAVLNGSLHSLDSQHKLAVAGEDAYATNNSVIIENGFSVGVIPINIVDDNIAELREGFIVNITAVEMVNLSISTNNVTFRPPRLGRYISSDVTIEANDGPHGTLVFSPSRCVLTKFLAFYFLDARIHFPNYESHS